MSNKIYFKILNNNKTSLERSIEHLTSFLSQHNETSFLKFNNQDSPHDLEAVVECDGNQFWSVGKSPHSRLVGVRFYSGPAWFSLKFTVVQYLAHSTHDYLSQLKKFYQNILNPMEVF